MKIVVLCIFVVFILKYITLLLGYAVSLFWCTYQKKNVNNKQRKRVDNCVDDQAGRNNEHKSIKRNILNYIRGFCEGCSRYCMFRVGEIYSFKIRNFLYRFVFKMNIQKETKIYAGCEFRNPWNITIGKSVIGPKNILDGRKGLVIGDFVCTGSETKIWTLQHDVQDALFQVIGNPVVIEDYAWIASHSTILPGKRVGRGAVISSGSVVTKDCDEYCIYAGIPCVKKGERTKKLEYTFESKLFFC